MPRPKRFSRATLDFIGKEVITLDSNSGKTYKATVSLALCKICNKVTKLHYYKINSRCVHCSISERALSKFEEKEGKLAERFNPYN